MPNTTVDGRVTACFPVGKLKVMSVTDGTDVGDHESPTSTVATGMLKFWVTV